MTVVSPGRTASATRWPTVTRTIAEKTHAIVAAWAGRRQIAAYAMTVSVPSVSPGVKRSERSSPKGRPRFSISEAKLSSAMLLSR